MSLDVALIQETFERIKHENGGTRSFGLRFYERLFEQYPSVRSLFTTDPEEQHKKLVASVGAIVSSITQPDRMVPYLRAMGIRHVKYGTEAPHYKAVQENFVAVLQEHLSKEGEWIEAIQKSWHAALETVSQVMIEAAANPDQYKAELEQAGFLADGSRENSKNPWEMPVSV